MTTRTGQGALNGDRTRQAQALTTFANSFAAAAGHQPRSSSPVTSTPTRRRTRSRSSTRPATTNLESTDDPDEESYNFDGRPARSTTSSPTRRRWPTVDGVDIWEINANETVVLPVQPLQLQRHEPLQRTARSGPPTTTRRSSASTSPTPGARPRSRSWHQRLPRSARQRPDAPTAGAGVLAGAVKQLRAANPNTVFAAAGDLIGASTFESFIAEGQADDRRAQRGRARGLVGRQPRVRPGVRRPGRPGDGAVRRRRPTPRVVRSGSTSRPTSARRSTTRHALAPTWTQDFGTVKVGFVGAVTEDLPALVSPGGIEEIYVTDIVDRGQRGGRRPEGRRCRHRGDAGARGCADHQLRRRWTTTRHRTSGRSSTASTTNIDAIVSGHTHLAYNCSFPVAGWSRVVR